MGPPVFVAVTAASNSPTAPSRTWKLPPVPAPDTAEGRVLIYALIVGIAYIALLVADATSLANTSGEFIAIPLILGTIASFAVGGMVTSGYSRLRFTELELARTVSVHGSSDQMPTADSTLGSVMKEYARLARDHRGSGRCHAYASGAIIWGTLAAFAAAAIWGVGLATGAIWPTYLALVVEIPALMLLTFGVAVLGTTIGVQRKVEGFDWLTPHRWRRFDERTPAVDEAIRTCPWLDQFVQGLKGSLDSGPNSTRNTSWREG